MIFGKNVNKFFIKYCYLYLIGLVALIAVDYFQLELPKITGYIIDGLKEETLTNEVIDGYLKSLLIVLAVMFTGRITWRICIFGTAQRVEASLRKDMFYHSESLSTNYYHENKTGALMALYTNDLFTVKDSFGGGIVMTIDVLVLGSMAFYRMFTIHWILALLSAIPLLLLACMGGVIGKALDNKWDQRQKAFEDLSDFTQENFSGINVVKAFVKEGLELLRFRKINKDNVEKNIEFVRYSTLLDVLVTLFISSIGTIILGYGGYLVINNTISIGNLSTFYAYFGSLTWPMIAIAQLINMSSQSRASLKRIDALLNEKAEIVDQNVVSNHPFSGKISFNHFSFKYKDSPLYALEDVTCEIKAGEMVGVIGKTGCGKTTLVNSLLRLYNVEGNKIFLDDIDIMRLPFKEVRNAIGYVPQDNFLYSTSVKSNIGFSGEYSDEEIRASAEFSDVHDNIVEFTDGYDTIIGERGVTLSGGQKQRISISRAIISNPKILIMDDSVSAVDTKTETAIVHNLRSERKGKTTLLIAHRISTVKNLDRILLMDEGKISDFGTHDELLERSSLYREMFELQKLEDEVDKQNDPR